MKQLLILSGKGGTGKTTIATAFIKLLESRAFADCDVDAPNLHLLIQTVGSGEKSDFYGMNKAEIDLDHCINCGLCSQKCRFDAIKNLVVDRYACEGCGVCEAICPVGAVTLKQVIAGELILYKQQSIFSTAQLKMGNGTSGMLVTKVKHQMIKAINNREVDVAIIDGSPGIGCPVIASLSGVDMALIVAEPSISGISDMERIIKTAKQFGTELAVCVNKYDTNKENTEKIKAYCEINDIPFVGVIPYDIEAVKAINNGLSLIDINCSSGRATKDVYEKTISLLLYKGC